MIISADCIEGTSSTAGGPSKSDKPARLKKKKLPAHRNTAQFQREHVYKIAKNLSKLSCNKTKITWKCLLTEILKVDSEVLPQNIALIAKLNDLCTKEREQYSLLCNENDFLAIKKLAKEKNCSISIIVKYLKNEVFNKKDAHKFIDDLLKPNSVHMAITVLDRSYVVKDDFCKNAPCAKKVLCSGDEMGTVNVVKDFVSNFYENLANLESYLNSVTGRKLADSAQAGHVCNHCLGSIVGTRYHCSVCPNFDLCEKCETVSEQVHDDSHLFLKIKKSFLLPSENVNLSKASSDNDQHSTSSSALDVSHVSALLNSNLNNEHDKSILSTLIDVKEVTSTEESNKSSDKYRSKNNKRSIENDKPDKSSTAVYNVEAGSKITKIWKIRNNGSTPWTSNLTLCRISGNIQPIPEQYSLPVPLLKPGQEDVISITFQIPSAIKEETSLFSVWRFCYKGKIFGKPLNLYATVKPNSSRLDRKEAEQCNNGDHLRKSLRDHDVTSEDEDSVVYPSCFNLDVPFLQTSGFVKDLSASLANVFTATDDQQAVVLEKKVSKNIDSNDTLISVGAVSSTSTVSTSRSNTCKNKNIAKKMELLENHRKACHAKKRQLKSVKPAFVATKTSNDLLIPVPSSVITEKIKCKNATNQAKINGAMGHIQSGTKKGDSGQEKIHKKSSAGKTQTCENSWTRPVSFPFVPIRFNNSSADNSKDPLLVVNMPNFSLVGQTLSSLCNMIANPGPSVNEQPSYNRANNSNRRGSTDSLPSALQKLFEMGFCNEKLNVELLIKNNLDIQRTVQELFSSIGNNLFSPTTSSASAATATSASQSTGGGPTTSSPSQPKPRQQEKTSKSCFSVDSVD